MADGWSELQTLAQSESRPHARRVESVLAPTLTAALAIVLTIQYVVRPSVVARKAYDSEHALPFPSATRLRLPPKDVRMFEDLVDTLHGRCRSVITLPGMLSLNEWSGLPAPSGMTEQSWWALLSDAELAAALRSAKSTNGLCLVRNDLLVRFWLGPNGQLPEIALVRFLEQEFVPVAHEGNYTISVRRKEPVRDTASPHPEERASAAALMPPCAVNASSWRRDVEPMRLSELGKLAADGRGGCVPRLWHPAEHVFAVGRPAALVRGSWQRPQDRFRTAPGSRAGLGSGSPRGARATRRRRRAAPAEHPQRRG